MKSTDFIRSAVGDSTSPGATRNSQSRLREALGLAAAIRAVRALQPIATSTTQQLPPGGVSCDLCRSLAGFLRQSR